MKFTSPLGWIRQAGAPKISCEKRDSLFYFQLVIPSSWVQVCISLAPTSTRSLNLRQMSAMIWIFQHLHYTQPWASEGGRRGPWSLPRFWKLTFSCLIFSKKDYSLRFEWEKWNLTIFGLPYKILGFPWKSPPLPPLEKSFRNPCTQRFINHGQLVNHTALIKCN